MTPQGQLRGTDVALVTGGSRGIGRATALALAGDGWRVAVNYQKNAESAEEVCHQITETGGVALPCKADVGKPEQVEAMFRTIKEKLASPAVLVNNAGIIRDTPLMLMKDEAWEDVIKTNQYGVFYCCRKAVRGMIGNRWGRIINVISPSCQVGREGQTNYSASKGAVLAMTKTIARELCRFSITVNAVSPGIIETEMTAGLPDKIKTEILNAIPLGRFGKPEEVAAIISFLASPKAEYITGQVIRIDGGLIMS